MLEGKKTSAILPESWKKPFINGVVIPVKMRRCNECNGKIFCTKRKIQINEKKQFEANLHFL